MVSAQPVLVLHHGKIEASLSGNVVELDHLWSPACQNSKRVGSFRCTKAYPFPIYAALLSRLWLECLPGALRTWNYPTELL